MDEDALTRDCLHYVRTAVSRALSLGDAYSFKVESGQPSHVGAADHANTRLAHEMFDGYGASLVIEEDAPALSVWTPGQPVIMVDPVDGSSELGCGGIQFSAAVSVYDVDGRPICGAAASPGLRPIYRTPTGSYLGIANGGAASGAVVFAVRNRLFLDTLAGGSLITVPEIEPRAPSSGEYTSVALDPNDMFACGLRKARSGKGPAIARMPFSNIFGQLQVILGQADAATLGPTRAKPFSGPKAWDLILPLTQAAGLQLVDEARATVDRLVRDDFQEGFVLNRRLFLAHPKVVDVYAEEIDRLLIT